MPEINEEDGLSHLDNLDKEHGVNSSLIEPEISVEKTDISEQKVTSLGSARSYAADLTSSANESPWKLLNLKLLPSEGLSYPENAEILLKSAKTKEIRHWSTIDEKDPIDVREKINFILNELTKFTYRVNNMPVKLNFTDFLEIDRYHILFRLYELTFPNQENKLWANIRCNDAACGHINRVQVTSQNLVGFQYPQEVMKWYSPEERAFVIESEKLGETIRLYLPTIGTQTKFRQKKQDDLASGTKNIDDSFYEFGPYLIKNWKKLDSDELAQLKLDSYSWPENKFVFIHKFTNLLKENAINKVVSVCEKCKQPMESSIFLGDSFTVKDIFIISAGLDELI